MAQSLERPPATVVDYDAWKRGYTPPSEHFLIDQLAYRGARVLMMSDWGNEHGAIWIVVRDLKASSRARKSMRELIELIFLPEPQEPYEYETPWC